MACIELNNVTFSYDGAHQALAGVTLSLEEGAYVCILGANGSGKSTLARHLNGLLLPAEGEVRVRGMLTSDRAHLYEIRSSVGMVFQNPDDQLVSSIVEDDVAFGPENLGLDPDEVRERVTDALARVGLTGFETRLVDELSGGQKQRVAIAGALAMRPRVLVLDEASSMLDPRGRGELLSICSQLVDMGIAVVNITHFMDEATCAQRVIVLDRGHVVLDGTPTDVLGNSDALAQHGLEAPFAAQLSTCLRGRGVSVGMHVTLPGLEEELARLNRLKEPSKLGAPDEPSAPAIAQQLDRTTGTGGHSRCLDNADDACSPTRAHEHAEAVLAFQDVSFAYESTGRHGYGANRGKTNAPALSNVSAEVRSGEIVGIAGHTGSGKSTLLQLCNGLLHPTSGRVLLDSHDMSAKALRNRIRTEVGLVFQYPEHQLFASSVFEDVAFGPRNLGLTSSAIEQRVETALAMVGLDYANVRDASPFLLSGGQQRLVAIAGVLAMEPRILVFDEPTAGLDPQARKEFLDLLSNLNREQGKTIVIASHDMDALALLCNRIVVLDNGAVALEGAPSALFTQPEALERIGLSTPAPWHLAHTLHIPLPPDTALPTAPQLATLLR